MLKDKGDIVKGSQRNFPCPCESGKKWKDCHPDWRLQVVDRNTGLANKDYRAVKKGQGVSQTIGRQVPLTLNQVLGIKNPEPQGTKEERFDAFLEKLKNDVPEEETGPKQDVVEERG